MKVLISGHRKSKLANYDIKWISNEIERLIFENPAIIGLSGMADGIDLLYCQLLLQYRRGYHCYIPFDEQDKYMSDHDKTWRQSLIDSSWAVIKAKNSQMVSDCDYGIIVWDGNKGGTHNVFQQMLEAKKNFWWIEPHNQKVIYF